MAKEKICFEQFLEEVDTDNQQFVHELHNYLIERGCKVTFEEAKNGYVASYKYGKPPKALMNIVFRKQGEMVRIYGSMVKVYPDFLNTIPQAMVDTIEKSAICKRLVHNTCSPKCSGYDFMIGAKQKKKCIYSCFMFLITAETKLYIKSFVECEVRERGGKFNE
jgi:hypothetical protein